MPATRQGTGVAALSTYIKNTLIPSIPSIRAANVYDYETTDLAGFPAVTITVQEIMGKTLDNARNERIYRFTIRVFIDRNKQNFGASKAESILRTIADDIIAYADFDNFMGGNCIDTVPVSSKFGYIDRENQNIRLCEVTLDCIDVITWR